MPAIRGVYTTHPKTAESGLWVELNSGFGIQGVSFVEYLTKSDNEIKVIFEEKATINGEKRITVDLKKDGSNNKIIVIS